MKTSMTNNGHQLFNMILLLFGKSLQNKTYLAPVIALLFSASAHAQLTSTFTRPVKQCSVAASENGVVQEHCVSEGSTVKKGDILGKLVDFSLQESKRLATLRAESTVKIRAAKASLSIKETHFESLKELQQKGHGNQRELDLAKLQYENAVAEFEIALEQQEEAKIELARIEAELEQRVIRSPIDGVVIDIHKEPGEYLAVTDPVFCTVVCTDQLRADFYLAADFIESIRPKDTVNVLIGNGEVSATATVVFRSTTLDPKSGTGRIEVEIDNANHRFLSGVRCTLVLGPSNQPVASQISRHPRAETKR